jgi:hypothetical protein
LVGPAADLELGKFTVKLNHRRLLDAMLAIAGVPAQKFRPICRSVHIYAAQSFGVPGCVCCVGMQHDGFWSATKSALDVLQVGQ